MFFCKNSCDFFAGQRKIIAWYAQWQSASQFHAEEKEGGRERERRIERLRSSLQKGGGRREEGGSVWRKRAKGEERNSCDREISFLLCVFGSCLPLPLPPYEKKGNNSGKHFYHHSGQFRVFWVKVPREEEEEKVSEKREGKVGKERKKFPPPSGLLSKKEKSPLPSPLQKSFPGRRVLGSVQRRDQVHPFEIDFWPKAEGCPHFLK